MQIMSDTPMTEAELEALRARIAEEDGIDKFTCDDCPSRYRCALSFDPYNTDGDCLAEK